MWFVGVLRTLFFFTLWDLYFSKDIYVDNSFILSTCNTVDLKCDAIQNALNIANNSDVIFVNPGVYVGSDNWNLCSELNCSQNLTIQATVNSFPPSVIINGTQTTNTTRAVFLMSNQIVALRGVMITSFAFTSEAASSGGSVFVKDSKADLESMYFENNHGYIGGGVFSSNGSLSISNCIFQNNEALVNGGAIAAFASSVVIKSTTFESNFAGTIRTSSGSGGAIYFDGINSGNIFNVIDSKFIFNTAVFSGGAVFAQASVGLISSESGSGSQFYSHRTKYTSNVVTGGHTGCTDTATCSSQGGALYLSLSTVYLSSNVFASNTVSEFVTGVIAQGGAIYSVNAVKSVDEQDSMIVIEHTIFSDNYAAAGGALFILSQPMVVTNCSFISNTVSISTDLFPNTAPQGGAIWYQLTSGNAFITNSSFNSNNIVGFGGALFATQSGGLLSITGCAFYDNIALSSYIFAAQGGAIMVTNGVRLLMTSTVFLNNSAMPNLGLTPLPFSGSGGALFVQSSNVTLEDCRFNTNIALTGQFDSGASGGAIALVDSYPVSILRCVFTNNGAAGYYGYANSISSPGAGGALYIKFSTANVQQSVFENNWVSAGATESSIGGAVAVFFEYSSLDTSVEVGVSFTDTTFNNNTAFGQLCIATGQGGTGGGLGINSVYTPTVSLNNVTFNSNVASVSGPKSQQSASPSFGGAVYLTLASSITISQSVFMSNFAIGGVGHDIASLSASQTHLVDCTNTTFYSINRISESYDANWLLVTELDICQVMMDLTNQFAVIDNNANLIENSNVQYTTSSNDSTTKSFGNISSFYAPEHNTTRKLSPENNLFRDNIKLHQKYFHAYYQYEDTNDDYIKNVNATSFETLLALSPNILIESGNGLFGDCNYLGNAAYHILFGEYSSKDYVENSGDGSATEVTQIAVGIFYGTVHGEFNTLVITVIKAIVGFTFLDNQPMMLLQLNVLNGSIYTTNDVVILGDTVFADCTVSGVGDPIIFHLIEQKFVNIMTVAPTIIFRITLYVGYNTIESLQLSGLSSLRNETQQTFNIIACNLYVKYKMIVDSSESLDTTPGINSASSVFILQNNATLNISTTGILILLCDTLILSDNSNYVNLRNAGEIALLGTSNSLYRGTSTTDSTVNDHEQEAALGSLTSMLTVNGEMEQTESGSLYLILNHTYSTLPPVSLTSNRAFGGSINVSFYINSNDKSYPNLILYDTDFSSAWSLISFSSITTTKNNTINQYVIDAPQGLQFKNNLTSFIVDSTPFNDQNIYLSTSQQQQNTFNLKLNIEQIGCNHIQTYYSDVALAPPNSQYPCYICLLNSSCSVCGDGACSVTGTCSAESGGALYSTSCCAAGCNPPYGVCKGNSDHTVFTCVCNGMFYSGNGCDELITSTIIAVFAPGMTMIVLGMLVHNLRQAYFDQVTQTPKWYWELLNLIIIAVNSGLFLYQLVLSHSLNQAIFSVLMVSRLPFIFGWVLITKALLFPNSTDNTADDLVHLLHLPSFGRHNKITVFGVYWLSPIVVPTYVAIVIMGVFDLTFFKRLPWIKTARTDVLLGFPTAYVFRCALYGNFIGNFIQLIGSAMGHSTLTLAQFTAFILYSGFMSLRSFVTIAFYVRLDTVNATKQQQTERPISNAFELTNVIKNHKTIDVDLEADHAVTTINPMNVDESSASKQYK